MNPHYLEEEGHWFVSIKFYKILLIMVCHIVLKQNTRETCDYQKPIHVSFFHVYAIVLINYFWDITSWFVLKTLSWSWDNLAKY